MTGQRAQLIHRVTELHDASTARWLADHHPYALELVADGWTINGALDHLDGLCDVTVCTHPDHHAPPALPMMALAPGEGWTAWCPLCSKHTTAYSRHTAYRVMAEHIQVRHA